PMRCKVTGRCASLPAWTTTLPSRSASTSWSIRSRTCLHAMADDMAVGQSPAQRPGRRRTKATPRGQASVAVGIARDLAWTGQHAQAVGIVSEALPHASSDPDASLALLEVRAESLVALGEMDRAFADA